MRKIESVDIQVNSCKHWYIIVLIPRNLSSLMRAHRCISSPTRNSFKSFLCTRSLPLSIPPLLYIHRSQAEVPCVFRRDQDRRHVQGDRQMCEKLPLTIGHNSHDVWNQHNGTRFSYYHQGDEPHAIPNVNDVAPACNALESSR
jgi:hypothetical protein